MATELEKIRQRLDTRAEQDRKDRARQAELVRQRIAEGTTWRAVQEEAGISRMTISEMVKGYKRSSTRKPARRKPQNG